MLNKPVYLFLMLGAPGSGKSYVAHWLSAKMQAVHIRSDDLRLAMFGADRLELHRDKKYTKPVAGAMEYIARQSLAAGSSMIADVNMNPRRKRQAYASLAAQRGAVAITVHVVVPLALAEQRVVSRAEQGGHQYFELEFVGRMARSIEMPESDEYVIRLDGTQDAASQQADFGRQLAAIQKRLP